MRRAAFLDRDGTLIEDAHYLAHPGKIRLVPGAVDAVRTLRDAGIVPIVVTNQSGIALGLLDAATYEEIRASVEQRFDEAGAPLAATYHCPHHPDVTGPCRCRKPGLGMYEQAVADHAIDPAQSLFTGDRRRDVEPALAFGGFGILVPSPDTPEADIAWAEREAATASSLEEAVARYLAWLAM